MAVSNNLLSDPQDDHKIDFVEAQPELDEPLPSPHQCPYCQYDEAWQECPSCHGSGQTEPGELYNLDPFWYAPEQVEPCSECAGAGGWWQCPNAGQPGHGSVG